MSLWFGSSKAELKPGPDLFPPKWTIAIAICAFFPLNSRPENGEPFQFISFFFSLNSKP